MPAADKFPGPWQLIIRPDGTITVAGREGAVDFTYTPEQAVLFAYAACNFIGISSANSTRVDTVALRELASASTAALALLFRALTGPVWLPGETLGALRRVTTGLMALDGLLPPSEPEDARGRTPH